MGNRESLILDIRRIIELFGANDEYHYSYTTVVGGKNYNFNLVLGLDSCSIGVEDGLPLYTMYSRLTDSEIKGLVDRLANIVNLELALINLRVS